MSAFAKVLIVGGPDVDQRIDLMTCLRVRFELVGVGSEPELARLFNSSGFVYRCYPLARRVRPWLDLLTVTALYRIIRDERPDLVHTFDTKPCVYGRLAAWCAGVPVIVGTLPGLGSLYGKENVRVRAVRYLYERLQAIACRLSRVSVFQNQEDMNQLVAANVVDRARAVVIPGSGVRVDRFRRSAVSREQRSAFRAEFNIPPWAVLVTMVSRQIRSKGVIEFAEAARAVALQDPTVRFLFVGPPDPGSGDNLTSNELAVVDQAVLRIGPRTDIDVILASSDIFVLPTSYREGIPRALLEAASMGLALVATSAAGCREVVTDRVHGLLVPPHHASALAEAILILAKDPSMRRRLGSAARARVKDRFTLSSIADRTAALYLRLLDQTSVAQTESR